MLQQFTEGLVETERFFDPKDLLFHPNGMIKSGTLRRQLTVKDAVLVRRYNVNDPYNDILSFVDVPFKRGSWLETHENGRVRQGVLAKVTEIDGMRIEGQIGLFDTGQIEIAKLEGPNEVPKAPGNSLWFGWIEFHPNGYPRKGQVRTYAKVEYNDLGHLLNHKHHELPQNPS